MFKHFVSVFFAASLLFSALPGAQAAETKTAVPPPSLAMVLEDIVHPDFEHMRQFRQRAEQFGRKDTAMFVQVYEMHLLNLLTVQTDLAQLVADYAEDSETPNFEEKVADFRAGTAIILDGTIALNEWRERALADAAEFADQECETVVEDKKKQCAFAHETLEFISWAYSTAIFKQ